MIKLNIFLNQIYKEKKIQRKKLKEQFEESVQNMQKIKFNKQKAISFLFDILLLILFLGAVTFLQLVQTITVNGVNQFCYISGWFWGVRVLTIGITSLFYDLFLYLLRNICKNYQKGYLIIRIILYTTLAIFATIMFASKQPVLIIIITSNLYTVHLCQAHQILYNKSNVIIKCLLNYAFLFLIVPSSYLCALYFDAISQNYDNGLYIGMIFSYIGSMIILFLLSLKTDKLRNIFLNKQEDGDSDQNLLQKIQNIKVLNTKQKIAKCAIIIYSLIFQFISIYLNTNGASIQEVYTYCGYYTQELIYCILLVFYLPLIKFFTIEDSVNILVVLNIILLCLKIIVGIEYYQIYIFNTNFPIIVAGFSQMLPMLISTLYKNNYDLLTQDQYVRLGLSFNFISFFFQNFQFKKMFFTNSLDFESVSHFKNDRQYYEQILSPGIQIGFNLLYLAQFYLCYHYFKIKVRNLKQMIDLKN
ncbi:transmembrane protein, putative (macronuclear) [Tetrahymena thermophila SB210]|uniref:Transmembrane protein, putative n=1 Tax=Tetrahymena thermophila (strain SB210) TaxID=312017 RepID=W7XDB3_TETTS|nr:transmembrane protein, putative [Tetrahymena thermophila SB210]EWS74628.1 transmembrane protein, putative [Tetrahymena thermophila SB210]|eukprot:XP_012652850.1 transmembrane protein, putative [Tetrahymena thermophila SB210]